MGEVAALSAAFEVESNKALATLPASCLPSNHDAHLNHHRIGQRITELILYYSSRLPPNVCVGRILSIGDKLSKQQEWKLALEACYKHVCNMSLHQQQSDVGKAAEITRLSYHVQACYGKAVCESQLVLEADPRIKHPKTLETLVSCLHQLKDALSMVLPEEHLYWLTLNGTVHIYTLAKLVLTAGFVVHMLPFLLFCVKALEQHVTFSTAKFLPWRTQLYTTLCYAYIDAQSYDEAKQVVQEGLNRIDALIKLQNLDPVPAPPECQAAYKTAKAMLCALRLKLEVQSAPNQPNAQPAIVPDKKDKKAAAAAADAPSASLAALQPLLEEAALTPKFKLSVMLEALQVPGRRVVRHAPVGGVMKDMWGLVWTEAQALIEKLSTAIHAAQPKPPEPEPPAEQAEAEPPASPTGKARAKTPPKTQPKGAAAATPKGKGKAAAVAAEPAEPAPPPEPAVPVVLVPCNPAESEDLNLSLHRMLLCTAFTLEQWESFEKLLAVAKLRMEVGAVGQADDVANAVFTSVVQLLEASRSLEQKPGPETLTRVASTLLDIVQLSSNVSSLPDMLMDVSLLLHQAAKQDLDGVVCAQDRGADLAISVLRSLLSVWTAVDLDDGVLRCTASLKLSLILEEQALRDSNTSLLYEARDVLTAARSDVTQFRIQKALMVRAGHDEGLRWITASKTQQNDAVAAAVSALPDTDAELACVHADILAALFRVEMNIGVAEQKAAAVSKQTKMVETIARREAQSSIFGVRTMKEKRLDESRVADAAVTPSNPQAKERELLTACGKNYYEKAIALMQMAHFQSELHRQIAMLTEAADCIVKAQEKEDAAFAHATPDRRVKTSTPLPPQILQRTPTSITLTNFPFNLKGGKKVHKYAVYAKSYGAGVALILNKTASEYPGTGVQVAPGSRITVQGLRTNDTYVFALAAFDDAGNLIGELGTSSVEILAGLALPLYNLWAALLLTCCKLKAWPLAKRAAGVLFPHFIVTTPDRPLWEANPMNSQVLAQSHVEVAAQPLLRSLVQCVYAYTGATLTAELAAVSTEAAGPGGTKGPAPPLAETRVPYIEEQVARLKCLRRLILAMQVSVILKQEALIQEGAVRCYQLLGPLLAAQTKSPMLHMALSSMYMALQNVRQLVQDSMVGQELQRHAAARVACAVTHVGVTMASQAGEGDVAAMLAGLQMDLVKAFDPKFSIEGRPSAASILPDLESCQDALLPQPGAKDWAAAAPGAALDTRMKDESDLAAQVLPLISGRAPMQAWLTYLCKEDNAQHPRWVELVVRMLERCLKEGQADKIKEIAEQVRWHVRAAVMRPALWFPGSVAGTKWKLEEAAAAVTGVTLAPEEEPVKPQLEGLSEAERAAAEQSWQGEVEAAMDRARTRTAAAVLLQKRLPVLLARKKVIYEIREKTKRWAPWRSRLATLVGLIEATHGRVEAAARAKEAGSDTHRFHVSSGGQVTSSGSGSRSVSPGPGSRPTTPPPTSTLPGKKGAAAAATKPGSPTGKGKRPITPPPPDIAEEGSARPSAGEQLATLRALQQLARAAHLAAREGQWHEALNAARHTWNIVRALLNVDTSLLQPQGRVVWEQADMPEPPSPPPSILQASGKDGKGGKAAAGAKKDDPKSKTKPGSAGKGGKNAKATGGVPEGPPAPVWPQIWLPTGSQLNAGRVLRSAAEALLSVLAAIRSGSPFVMGVLPMPPKTEHQGALPAAQPSNNGDETTKHDTTIIMGTVNKKGGTITAVVSGTARSVMDDASSAFSYGSDLQADLWFQNSDVDMAWCNRYLVTIMNALHKMQRWNAVVAVGQDWTRVSEAHFSESVLPILLSAAPAAGLDVAAYQAAMEAVMRDKNAALDALDKVRSLVRDRIGEVTLLNQAVSSKVKKKKSRAAASVAAAARHHSSSGGAGGDTASTVSAYTYTTTASRTASQMLPDFQRIPNEYEKAIEVLKSRGEKGAMILATHELGDVHAHFGNWGGAVTAWNDALDTLMGPYQVVRNWRKLLDPLSDKAIMQRYGLSGCLLAGGILLGKLARYAHYSHLTYQLECARMAAVMTRAVFCGDILHPQRMVGFAVYVPARLWKGLDPFQDPYRCNVTDLLSGLETVVSILLEANLALEALPVIALWEHAAYLVTRDLQATVMCRLQRVHACVQLGLMQEAAGLLSDLIQGCRLPDPVLPDSPLVIKDADGKPIQVSLAPPFVSSAYPGLDTNNTACTQVISEGSVPQPVVALYGDWLMAKLALARAAFLQALGSMPNMWNGTSSTTTTTNTDAAARGRPAAPNSSSTTTSVPAASYESTLLQQALALVSRAKAMARGEAVDEASAGKDKKTPAPAKKAAGGDASDDTNPTITAQRYEVMVRALLAESRIEALRWRPQPALEAALAALKFMGEKAASGGTLTGGGGINIPLGDNDDTDRFALSPGLWLKVRHQAVTCCYHLRNIPGGHAMLDTALLEASSVSDQLYTADMLQLRAALQHVSGCTAKALQTYSDVIARYQGMQLSGPRLIQVLTDAASLRDILGLREDSLNLYGNALMHSKQWVTSLGLNEAREHPELINMYAAGLPLHAHLLERNAVCAMRQRKVQEAKVLLSEALHIHKKYSRALPVCTASTALQLGRCIRLSMLMPSSDTSNTAGGQQSAATSPAKSSTRLLSTTIGSFASGAGAMSSSHMNLPSLTGMDSMKTAGGSHHHAVDALSEQETFTDLFNQAQATLSDAFTMAATDGGQSRTIMRDALLELASLYIQGGSAAQAAACLRAAHAVATKQCALLLASHSFTPVNTAQIPEWLQLYVQGQEQAFKDANGHGHEFTGNSTNAGSHSDNTPPRGGASKSGPAATKMPDADMGRLFVCYFTSLLRSMPSLPASEQLRLTPCLINLHHALRAACPKYVTDACVTDVALPPAEPPSTPTAAVPSPGNVPGTVQLQWAVQDGCWQEAESWQCYGSLPGPNINDSDILALQPIEPFASLVHLIVTFDGEVVLGEKVYKVASVRALQDKVRQLRHRLESPKGPTDLFGYVAPTGEELAHIRALCERVLSCVNGAALMADEDNNGATSNKSSATHETVHHNDEQATSLVGTGSKTASDQKAGQQTQLGGRASAKAPGAAGTKPGVGGKDKDAAAAAAGPPEAVPTDLQFLIKMEALLDVENGLQLQDTSFAELLAGLLK